MLIVFKLLGSIALLMYGMKVMSEALQKMAGPQLRHVLGKMTTNRVTGVMTGMAVCVAVQSSAATTVMTVSFVNAALLTLSQAISVIMGANIGTTLSAWIMSAGFSFNIANLVWPVFLVAVILIQFKKHRYLGDFLFGLSFMFFALGTLNATGREMDLASNEQVVNFFSSFDSGSYLTILVFLVIGAILTCIAQSSAALMAITMVLCTTGVLTIYQGIALVMGENIGTTVTANLAALSANTQARRTALAHLVFNVFGVHRRGETDPRLAARLLDFGGDEPLGVGEAGLRPRHCAASVGHAEEAGAFAPTRDAVGIGPGEHPPHVERAGVALAEGAPPLFGELADARHPLL